MNKKQQIFIKNTKEKMKEAAYTQENLAKRIEISSSYLSLLFSGNRLITPVLMEKIAAALSTSVKVLLYDANLSTKDYDIYLRGSLSNRTSKIAYQNILLDMDNFLLLSKD